MDVLDRTVLKVKRFESAVEFPLLLLQVVDFLLKFGDFLVDEVHLRAKEVSILVRIFLDSGILIL